MGFALWIDRDEHSRGLSGQAWAQGTHEYKPMGVAVIAITDQFHQRDFSRRRHCPSRLDRSFVGLFASVGELNDYLKRWRSQSRKINMRRPDRLTFPYI